MVNTWSLVVFGAVLPLVISRQLERRTRRLSGWQEPGPPRHPGAPLAQVFLASCFVWVAATVAVPRYFS